MARFAGKVGFGVSTEVRPGVWKDIITERSYFGDVKRVARQVRTEDKVNDEIGVENLIEIVADAFANEHFIAIRYVDWAGTKWKVPSVEVQHPRLIMRLGGVYNGPAPVVP
jgi:hypothetical protein